MTKKHKPLTFYYKKIKLDEEITLQEILESLSYLTPEQRKITQGKKTYILNNVTSDEGLYYGEIICFEADKAQGIIHDAVRNNNLLERVITTKDVSADKDELKDSTSEFVNSRIIFGLSGNNLAICPSILGVERFVTYFNSLLDTYYWKDPESAKVLMVTDVYQKTLQEKLKTTHVRNVKIGQGVIAQPSGSSTEKPFKLEDKSLLGKIGQAVGKHMGFRSAMDDANLRVNVTIDYLRDTSTEGHQVLDDITTALATLDDSYIEINFVDGSDFKRGNIRVKGVINQHLLSDSNFDRIALVEDIRSFLRQSIE